MGARLYFATSSIVLFLAVLIGAFGAHGLQHLMTERGKEIFQTGSLYHFIHGIALFLVGLLVINGTLNPSSGRLVYLLLLVGIIIFSGSLYALALTQRTWLGAITPLGGVLFLLAWFLLGWAFITKA
jgi:uncharacterized membrane protein YgdD (TMEM256/DUF423 family)